MAMSVGKTVGVIAAVAGLCVMSGLIGAAAVGHFDVAWGDHFNVDFGQSISIILSALGAILTALALLFAAMAVIGWSTFSNQVDWNVRRYIKDDFDKQGPIFQTVVKDLLPRLEQSMYQGTQPPAGELEPPKDDELVEKENPDE